MTLSTSTISLVVIYFLVCLDPLLCCRLSPLFLMTLIAHLSEADSHNNLSLTLSFFVDFGADFHKMFPQKWTDTPLLDAPVHSLWAYRKRQTYITLGFLSLPRPGRRTWDLFGFRLLSLFSLIMASP